MTLPQGYVSHDYIKDSSKDYSIYVCSNRAIPDVRDGLKNGQRQALFLIRNKGSKMKVIELSGEMMGSNLYLHGDASASDAISRLAAPYMNNVPFLKGKGNFGKRSAPDSFGAPRYVSVVKAQAADAIMFPDKDIVPMKWNYDGSKEEPECFLPIIPAVLLNGIGGIAVGWSTEIFPHKLDDLIDATVAALDGKKVPTLKPNFTYLNCDVHHLEDNSWEFHGKVDIVDTSTCVITELPPWTRVEKFKEFLDSLEEQGKINGYDDNTSSKVNIEVKFKRGSIASWNENKAMTFFKLKQKKTQRIIVLDWNGSSIREYTKAEDLVKDFADWRMTWYVKRYQKMLDDASYELNYWLALKACFDDKLPERLLDYKSRKEMNDEIKRIAGKIPVDNDQIGKISGLSTYRWAKDYYQEVLKRIKELQDMIKDYEDHLGDHTKIKKVFKDELSALKAMKL